jgi:DNA-binding PadR family transcriptional regulator
MPPHSLTPRTPQPDKTLLTAWLLLFLRRGEQHGWALRTELAERGIVVDGARIYRHLRELESEGSLTSRWTASVGGPKRRCYRLAEAGPARLDELAATISATWRLHAEFVEAHERGDGGGAPPAAQDAPGAPKMGRELVAAWLLLLLDHEASYGYDLRQALKTHHVDPDPGTLYRVLRQLDAAGWLQSRWTDSASGPRRRLYRVTAKGRRSLVELAELITGIRDTHRAFLQEYERSTTAAQ